MAFHWSPDKITLFKNKIIMRYLLLISIHQTYFIMKNGDTANWKSGGSATGGNIVKEHEKSVAQTIKAQSKTQCQSLR